MTTLWKSSVLGLLFAGIALAETYSGTLVDASCLAPRKNTTCIPTATTTSFALITSGNMFKLDARGNSKAAVALKEHDSGANRSKHPHFTTSGVIGTIMGTTRGDQIFVESIQLE